jgi:lipid-binding SYLF domain-containing protein
LHGIVSRPGLAMRSPYGVLTLRSMTGLTRWGAFLAAGLVLSGCSRQPAAAPGSEASTEQQLVDRSADALVAMRDSGRFPALVFPRVIKAGLILGGSGGNGVLVARQPDGSWSAPAFYSLGGGSAGAQIGFQQAAVVLCFMSESALRSAIDRGLTLGTDASVAAGTIGNSGKAVAKSSASDIYQLVNAGGLFAGVSLTGTVVSARDSFNRAYYGPEATTRGIVVDGRFDRPSAAVLKQALSAGERQQ